MAAAINPKINQSIGIIYGHWRRLRDKYKRPLLRRYWKANYKADNSNNMKQAFMSIKKDKMRLRKNANKSDIDL